MVKRSPIPNKIPITIVINSELKQKAQELGLNISLILDAALSRELDPDSKEGYVKKIEERMQKLDEFLKEKDLKGAYYDYILNKDNKGGENVVLDKEGAREIRERNIGQAIADLKDS